MLKNINFIATKRRLSSDTPLKRGFSIQNSTRSRPLVLNNQKSTFHQITVHSPLVDVGSFLGELVPGFVDVELLKPDTVSVNLLTKEDFTSLKLRKQQTKLSLCLKHNTPSELFCTQCAVTFCSKCHKDHAHHPIISVYLHAFNLKDQMKEQRKNIDGALARLEYQQRNDLNEKKMRCSAPESLFKLEEAQRFFNFKQHDYNSRMSQFNELSKRLNKLIESFVVHQLMDPRTKIQKTIEQVLDSAESFCQSVYARKTFQELMDTPWEWEEPRTEVQASKHAVRVGGTVIVAAKPREVGGLTELRWSIRINTSYPHLATAYLFPADSPDNREHWFDLNHSLSGDSIIDYVWRIAQKELDLIVDEKLEKTFTGLPDSIVPAFAFEGRGEVEFIEKFK